MGYIPKAPHCVYAIRCKANGKMYIGVSVSPDKRVDDHLSQLRRGEKTIKIPGVIGPSSREKSNFQKDFDEYGEENFEYYILEKDVSPDKSRVREMYWILHYKSSNPDYGYNIYPVVRTNKVVWIEALPPVLGKKNE